jgi:hypothetical protein
MCFDVVEASLDLFEVLHVQIPCTHSMRCTPGRSDILCESSTQPPIA